MPAFNLEKCGETLVNNIKMKSWFPVDTGNLRDRATTGKMISEDVYRIKFDSTIAPYIKYLEEGTTKTTATILTPGRNISGFGVPFDSEKIGTTRLSQFKVGKHMGFISDKTINYIINYICKKYKGEVR